MHERKPLLIIQICGCRIFSKGVRNSRGKRGISVWATEGLLYLHKKWEREIDLELIRYYLNNKNAGITHIL